LSTYESMESQPERQGDATTDIAGSFPEESFLADRTSLDEPAAGIAVSEPFQGQYGPATTGMHHFARTGLPERITVIRAKAKEERRRRARRRREGFSWHEREWESRFWAARLGITPHTVLTVSLIIVVGLFVFLIAARAATRPSISGAGSARRQNANPIIIQQEGSSGGGSATPTLPTYILGVWVSSMSPAASGEEQVYVRVTENTSTDVNEPVPNVKVQVTCPYGVARSNTPPKRGGRGDSTPSNTAVTDANGLAIFTLFYGAGPGGAVYVFASATINGQQIGTNTDFVAG
jgi:hypothetical protein